MSYNQIGISDTHVVFVHQMMFRCTLNLYVTGFFGGGVLYLECSFSIFTVQTWLAVQQSELYLPPVSGRSVQAVNLQLAFKDGRLIGAHVCTD